MAELLYAGEHLDCPNYDNRQRPSIEEIFYRQGDSCEVQPWVNKLIFVSEGELECSAALTGYYPIHSGQILFLPANRSLSCSIVKDTHITIIRLYEKIQLCDCFRLEDLKTSTYKSKGLHNDIGASQEEGKGISQKDCPYLLNVNPVMERYLELLNLCYRAGLRCRYYNEGKVRELMFILRAFYSKEQLARFFATALTTDTYFSQFVMSNYTRYNNLTDLAQAMGYTVSGFEKKFRKVFQCAPYAWMRRQRAREAYHCIKTSDLSLKQIGMIFGFSSHPAFIKFIRQNFGQTPGQIRKKITMAEMDRI
ncbi:AraC-like DNA-binding protein [Dysgonomonas sp. PFB1-18]|uniref:helix-turn-helix transcriptional regulator n=1 Tax=unclassified Dysgonomonas TaxID=2630389 RepID=UPI002473E960|nr:MULTISPECIES: helix-turn-helix transcriptional regulator [unclassified Dysgonomonas]MDH6311139.1 AraC-like DNA-binding protein [Dysgonomonas sp. PF1-14]MDH6341007.1 AraC-like DNA-binding protein [Dysgonomonas sp. PF1-16]MDH6382647.1 AraC-like DNA-binding protein [Dysgonomonas sp. PFB1-18]MDH6400004.1 AraC-like DNA-binding protein [Dysgonomonas sp. PF1-23]